MPRSKRSGFLAKSIGASNARALRRVLPTARRPLATFIVAFAVLAMLATGLLPVRGRAASVGFDWPAIVTNKVLSQTISNGSNFYLAWNYSVTSGTDSTNAQALAIDNISIQATQTISGTVIGNHGSGSPLTGKKVTLVSNASTVGSTTTDGSGVYTFSGVTLANNDRIGVFIDDETENGFTATLSSTVDIANLNIFQDVFIVRSDNGSVMTNTHLSFATNSDADANAVVSFPGSVPTTSAGTDLRIWNATTYTPGGNVIVGGDWINFGSFSAGTFVVTLNSSLGNQSIGGLNPTTFASLVSGNSGFIVSLANTTTGVTTSLLINSGVFSQGESGTDDFSLTTNTVTVQSGAVWRNLGKGDLTLTGNVTNNGTINFNANGTPCGGADDIVIVSSAPPTQRTWSGTGTFSMTDVAVSHQKVPGGLSLPLQIIVNDGTDAGTNTGWTFSNTCSGPYTWIGGAGQDWTIPINWSPIRSTAAAPTTTDVLIFDAAVTPAPIVLNVPAQTIAALRLTGAFTPAVTLNASGTNTLEINGATATDFDIPSGTGLFIAGANALTISLTGAGHQSTIAGLLVFQDGAHSLTGTNAGEITFASGSIFTAATGFSGNPFGAGTNGSVVFESGSAAFFNAGGDPFGGNGNAVTVFNLGSTVSINAQSALSCSDISTGRTYGNLILDKIAGGSTAYQCSGSQALTILNDLTIQNNRTFTLSNSAGGDLNLQGNFANNNQAGGSFGPNGRTVIFNGGSSVQTRSKDNGAHETFGDVIISKTGGSVRDVSGLIITGTLQFNGTNDVLDLNGSSLTLNGTISDADPSGSFKGHDLSFLTINGSGPLGAPLRFVSGSEKVNSLTLNRTSGQVNLGTNLTIGNPVLGSLTLTNGIIDTVSNTLSLAAITTASRTNGYVIGNLQKTFAATGNFTFPVGTANAYSPLDANVTAGTGNSLTVKAVEGKLSAIAGTNALQRYWTISNLGGITANLTFHYRGGVPPGGDIAGTEANYKIFKYDGSFTQFTPDVLNTTSHFATLNNVSSFSDWTLAEPTSVFPDLNITKTDSPDPVTEGNSLTYLITATNNGANATGVVVNDPLPANVTFVSATPSQGSCTGTTTVNCTFGSISSGNNATVTIVVTPTHAAAVAGSVSNTATVSQNETDANNSDNSAPQTTTVRSFPAIVYVDDDWASVTPGTDPDAGGPATEFGYDAFATIQNGINGVATGGTINVLAGTYAEAVLIDKPLMLLGAQAGQNANTRFAAFIAGGPPNGSKADPAVESVITAAAVNPTSNVNNTVHVMADNVTIDGFVIDGNNPALPAGGAVVISGINTDSRRGIETEDAAGAFFAANNVTVKDNVIQNFSQRGVELVNPTNTSPATSGSLITGNHIRIFGLEGIVLAFNACADITFNTVVTPDFPTEAGIWVQDFGNGATPTAITIANNNVTVGQDNFGGIWVNLAYLPDLNINNNTVNAAAGVTGNSGITFGIYLSSQRPGSDASLTGNIVGASGGEFSRGIALWSLGSATPTTVTGGTVGKSLKGVSLHVNDPNFGLAGANSAASTSGVIIDGTGVGTSAGIFVDATDSTGDTVAMEVSGNTSISGCTTGISIVGINASANIHDNVASIHDNTTGIFVQEGAATITHNYLYGNVTSLNGGDDSAAGPFTAHFNRIISTTNAIANPSGRTLNIQNNWWGCNAGPGNAGCGATDALANGFNPWIVLLGSATPPAITPGGSSTVAADMTHNSADAVPVGTLPNIPVGYTATNGNMVPTNDTIVAGADSSTFTSTNSSNAVATITVDNEAVNVPITVNAPAFSIDDVTHLEGDPPGTTSYVFTITKTGATALSSSVSFTTQDGSATTANNDYALNTDTLNFGPSDTTMQITVLVNRDYFVEADENFTVLLSGATNATISDSSGTGTITNDDTAPSVVYVDDDWLAVPIGTDPDGGGLATAMGYDAFATIQNGINGVATGGTVNVRPGTYAEAVLIDKPLMLLGAQAGQDANTRFAAFTTGPDGPKANPAVEAIITAAAVNPTSNVNNTIHVMADNVTIDGFVVDGNNPALTPVGAVVVGGINTDVRRGIQTENAAGAFFAANGVQVKNNVIQNFAQRGVELVNPNNASPATSGSVITGNLIRNFSTTGIVLAFNAYADVTSNTIITPDLADAGVMIQDFLNVGSPPSMTIANNSVTVGQDVAGGIWVNLAYLPTVNINTNTVNAAAGVTGASDLTYGIYVTSLRPGTTASVSGNIVGASGGQFARGIALWNLGTIIPTTVTGGTIGNSLKGVSLHDNDPNFGLAGANSAVNTSGVSIDGTGVPADIGIFVDAAGSTGDTVAMEIFGNTSISGCTTAISVVGANASANIHNNAASIHDNQVGIAVDGGLATIISNNLYANGTSLRFTNGATGTAHFNRILSTTTAIDNPNNLTPNLENNWWGCNAGPGNAGCGAVTGTGADFDPWIVLLGSATPNSITPGGTSTVAADMTHNSAGTVPVGTLPNIPDSFSATNGTMNPTSGTIVAGADSSTFTSTNSNDAVVTVTVDNQDTDVPITVNAPSFSIDDVTHLEGNGGPGTTSYTFTITKTGATAFSTSVDYATVNGTATAPSDFTALLTTNQIFLPGDTTKQVTVLVNGDTTVEPDEAFTVHLSNASGATIADPDGTGTIQNDDTEVSVAVSPLAVAEDGAPNLVYTFTRSGVTTGSITANFSVGGTANSSNDYLHVPSGTDTFTPPTGTVTFGAGISTATVTIDPTADISYEPDETVVLTVTSGTGYNIGSPSIATGTITNEDAIPATLVVTKTADTDDSFCSLDDCSLREAMSNANANADANTIGFNIPISDPNRNGTTGVFTISPGSALPAISNPVTIDGYTQTPCSGPNPAPCSQENTLAVGSDAVLLIEINGTLSGGYALIINASNTVLKGLVINRSTQSEIWMNTGTNLSVRGNFLGTDAAGTADLGNTVRSGIEINATNGNTIGGPNPADRNVISGGNGSGIFLINGASNNTVQNNYIGPDKTGNALDLGNASGGIVIDNRTNNTIQGNIISGNDADGVAIRGDFTGLTTPNKILGNFIGVRADGTAMGNVGAGVHLYSGATNHIIGGTSPGEGNTIAFNGGDGVSLTSGVNTSVRGNSIFSNGTFASAALHLGIDLGPDGVTANDDGAADDIDTGANNLQNFPIIASVVVGTPNTISGTLDSTPSQTFTIDFYSSPAGSCDPSGNGEGRVYLGSKTTTTDANGLGGFRFNPATLSANDVITATATDSAGNTSEFSLCKSAVAIAFGQIKFALANAPNTNDTETNSSTHVVNIVVQRVGGADRAVSVDYEITDGTTNPATTPEDYSAANGTLTWANGDATDRNIPITVKGDTKFELNETVSIKLVNALGGATIAGDNPVTLTIVNDDTPPTISINDVSHSEGNAGTTDYDFTVSLSNASYLPITVNAATADNTALTGDSDYTGVPSTLLTFSPNTTTQQFHVLVNGDNKFEANETFFVNLSGVNANATILDPQGLGTITNDDPLPTISIDNVTHNEGNLDIDSNPVLTDYTFTVSLSNPSDQTITVDYATANDSAVAPSDYTAITTTTLTFDPGETSKPVTVVVKGDTIYELNERFFVNLSNVNVNATILDGQGDGTITNDDAPPTLSISDRNNFEGTIPTPTPVPTPSSTTAISFTVTKAGSTAVSATVHFATADGGTNPATGGAACVAGSGVDYISQSGDLTFPASGAGSTSQTITIVVCKDSDFEPNETFFVNLSAETHSTLANAQAVGTIKNDDIPSNGFIVTTTNDLDDGTCAPAPGHCSLREAINASNTSLTPVAINFAIPAADPRHFYYADDGTGVPNGHVTHAVVPPTTAASDDSTIVGIDPDWAHSWWSILPTSPLPTISQQVFIEGYTQLGATVNTLTTGSNAVLRIELNGESAGANVNGLTVSGSNSTVRGLVINRFKRDSGAGTPAGIGLDVRGNSVDVVGNFIGTDVSGTLDLGNGGSGIGCASGGSHTIGGTTSGIATPEVANLISGNDGDGISVTSTSNLIQGNWIGTAANGTSPLGNSGSGIGFSGGGFNTVGIDIDPTTNFGEGNTIAFNTGDGVLMATSGVGNSIRGNSIYSNGSTANTLGIDLGTDGITAPDATDADTGPNNLQNFPIITLAQVTGSTRTITGTLNSTPNAVFTIDFYQSPACDTSGNGEGKTYITSITTDETDANGDVSFTFHPTPLLDTEQFLTATATSTGATFSTSEFSQCTDITDGSPGAGDIQFTDATYTVGEGGGTASITVKRVGGSNGSVTANFSTVAGGTATAGSDYTATTTSITFLEGETADQTVTVPIADDGVFESNETVFLSLGDTGINATRGKDDSGIQAQADPHSAVLTITDNDSPPSFAIDDVTHNEGNAGTTSYTFTVTKTGSTALSSSVNFTTVDGTATTANNDYQLNSGPLNFLPTDTSKQITVLVTGDVTFETTEAFTVNLSGASNATISDADGTGTITNDDSAPTFAIGDVTHLEGDSETTDYVFTVTRTGSTQLNATVDYATFDGTADSTSATPDFSAIPTTTLLFLPADTSKQFTVTVNGDRTVEPNEAFSVNLSNPTNATISDSLGLGNITNDDTDVTVAVSPSAVAEDGAPNLVYTFTRTGVTGGALTVNFTLGGTADSSSDYTPSNGTVTFADGSPTTTVTIDPTADSTVELDETVILTLAPGTGYNVASPSAATGTITNDDTDVTVAVSPATVAEDGVPNLVYTFTRNGVTSSALTVNFSVSGTAVFGTDYTQTDAATFSAASGTVTFGAGSSTAAVTIDPATDLTFEPDETVILTVTSGTGYNVASPSSATGTITNDDAAGGIVKFSAANYDTTENSHSVTITVERVGDTTAAVSVDYATPDDSAATTVVPCADVTGLASPRCDFTTALGTLRFAAGDGAPKTFNVLISQDNYGDGTETLTLTLSNLTGGAVFGVPSTATITIADDATEPATNPIDDADNFVRQHYHDFLNREPDADGLAFWTNEITQCGTDAQCIESKRINVSAAFYLSIEFQNTGYLVERLYKGSYGDATGTSTIGGAHQLAVPIVQFSEFLPDTQTIGQGVVVGQSGWETVLENNKQAFVAEFVQRSRFTTAYANTLTPEDFVDLLFTNAGVTPTPTERQAAIDEFGGAGTSANAAARGRALRRVAENSTLAQQEFNRAFVLMQYFGYLRRNPNAAPDSDHSGYDFWLTKLNNFTQPGDEVLVRVQKAEMVKAFIVSGEYRQRFGP